MYIRSSCSYDNSPVVSQAKQMETQDEQASTPESQNCSNSGRIHFPHRALCMTPYVCMPDILLSFQPLTDCTQDLTQVTAIDHVVCSVISGFFGWLEDGDSMANKSDPASIRKCVGKLTIDLPDKASDKVVADQLNHRQILADELASSFRDVVSLWSKVSHDQYSGRTSMLGPRHL